MMDLALEVSPPALAEITKVGFDPVFGAVSLKRALQHRVENPLSSCCSTAASCRRTRSP